MPGVSPGQLFNDSLNHSGPWAAPGGTVVGKDGQVMREMITNVSTLLGGDAVILDSSNPPYGVVSTSLSDSPRRYGIVTGAQIGVAAQASASGPVWVVIEGPAWANGSSNISVGDMVGTTSLVAGHVWKSAVGGLTGKYLLGLPATVSLATSWASFTAITLTTAVTGLLATDTPINFTPNASLVAGLIIGGVWTEGTTSVGVRIANPTATAVASQASIPGILTVARGSSLGAAGTILGVALTSTGAAASTAVQIFVTKA